MFYLCVVSKSCSYWVQHHFPLNLKGLYLSGSRLGAARSLLLRGSEFLLIDLGSCLGG